MLPLIILDFSVTFILYEMLSPRQVGDAKKKDRDRKEKSVGPKQRELHELPYIEIID